MHPHFFRLSQFVLAGPTVALVYYMDQRYSLKPTCPDNVQGKLGLPPPELANKMFGLWRRRRRR